MKLHLFSIYDSKVNSYQSPFPTTHQGYALRHFESLVNDTSSPYGQNPSDFTLFSIGSFDTDTGKLEPLQAFENLGQGLQFLKQTNN